MHNPHATTNLDLGGHDARVAAPTAADGVAQIAGRSQWTVSLGSGRRCSGLTKAGAVELCLPGIDSDSRPQPGTAALQTAARVAAARADNLLAAIADSTH